MLQQPAFGRRLRQLRAAQGLSQTALAGDGMSTAYLSRLETGARRPTPHAVTYLAARLGVPPDDLAAPAAGSLADALALAASLPERSTDAAADAVREALAGDPAADPVLRWQALWLLARERRGEGDHAGQRAHLDQLVALGEEIGLAELRVRGLTGLARCLRSLGEIGPALHAALTAHALADGLGVEDRAGVLLALVSVEAEAGRLPEARAHADELTGLVEGRTDTLWAEALWTAAAVRVRQGEHAAAQVLLDRALEGYSGGEDLVLWLRLRFAAARLHLQRTPPRTADAAHCVAAAEPALAFVGTAALRQELALLKAELAFHAGRHEEAGDLLAELVTDAPRLTYRDRVRLDVLRHRLRFLSGDDTALHALRGLALRAQTDASLDLATELWGVVADLLLTAREG
ncbi:helix-turn-helix transcriptional regulator [Streptomyces sp. NPDC046909]|uniref:helix-turn-helix transcriptional regulator n=1 Tax=Streptomyces sp. NPDC046909 TaxID=3155617 RepID=UPI0034082036